MGKLPHIAAMIYNQPLLITEEKLYEILEAIGPRIGLEILGSRINPFPNNSMSLNQNGNGLAIIDIHGTLTHEPMFTVNAQSGLMSYQTIKVNFDQALNDPQVNTILLNINSNGGQVSGAFDLVDHIYNSRGTKPIIAISNESAYSAAYAIGSAADKFYVTRTAGVGSIGVIAIHQDISKKLEKEGVTHKVIKAGKHKDDLSPLKPLTKEAEDSIQEKVNSTQAIFVNTIARNRNLDVNSIYAMEARTYDGQKAVDIGLADKVTTYDNVINTYGGNNNIMAKLDTDFVLNLDVTEAEDKIKKLNAEVIELKSEIADMTNMLPSAIEEAATLGQTNERKRIMAILEKCIAGKKIELIEDFVKNGNTPEQAAALIMQSKALESKYEEISSTTSGISQPEANALIKNAEKRAEEYCRK